MLMRSASRLLFQSTLPRGERQNDARNLPCRYRISIHAPARGATLPAVRVRCRWKISIHAPARGATAFFAASSCASLVFQSTLPRGERLSRFSHEYILSNFNPRSREGSDAVGLNAELQHLHISIHAPARGATHHVVGGVGTLQFQSTLPRGERRMEAHLRDKKTPFQSTLPRGERRPRWFPRQAAAPEFQSTLPRGERQPAQRIPRGSERISIHAPARGATLRPYPVRPTAGFQSTLPRGERQPWAYLIACGAKFQSTLPRGERPAAVVVAHLAFLISIHAPARGATWCCRFPCSFRWYFNPRSREGSDLRFWRCRRRLSYFNPRSREGSDQRVR